MPAAAPPSARAASSSRITLIAMTLAGSVVLVDQTAVPLAIPHIVEDLHGSISDGQWVLTANLLPLAAFMVLGGRFGDLFGLRRMFLIGSLAFFVATVLATSAQDIPMLVVARIVQGAGAALMMPNSISLVSAVFPSEWRGSALGVMAGGTAFFAALGPVVGGALTSIDWRLIFVLNGALTLVSVALTLLAAPRTGGATQARVDVPGVLTFAIGIGATVFGIGQLAQSGVGTLEWAAPLVVGGAFLAAFVAIELRVEEPLIDLHLLRNRNFLAANLSQVLAGAIELGLGFLLPFQLLLVVGVTPAAAGLALLPASVPIVLVGPLAGRAYDRFGGRWPLAVGFGVLALSGLALALAVSHASVLSLLPGLLLQGVGLGLVLTVNDPVGLSSVPAGNTGEAAGMINTAEQLGGALGITAFLALEYRDYIHRLYELLGARGIKPTPAQVDVAREYLLQVEQAGVHHTREPPIVRHVFDDITAAHVAGFRLAFAASAGVALLGAALTLFLVRRDVPVGVPIRSRRSRWVLAAQRELGRQPAERRSQRIA